jgi:hypothetical protein
VAVAAALPSEPAAATTTITNKNPNRINDNQMAAIEPSIDMKKRLIIIFFFL